MLKKHVKDHTSYDTREKGKNNIIDKHKDKQ